MLMLRRHFCHSLFTANNNKYFIPLPTRSTIQINTSPTIPMSHKPETFQTDIHLMIPNSYISHPQPLHLRNKISANSLLDHNNAELQLYAQHHQKLPHFQHVPTNKTHKNKPLQFSTTFQITHHRKSSHFPQDTKNIGRSSMIKYCWNSSSLEKF